MKISPARVAAFDVLLRIEKEKAYSSVLLPFVEAALSPADRGLCHELTLGTLRRQIYLDEIINKLSSGKKIDIEVRIALRLALYQLIYLDKIPAYSAINESVNLVQKAKKTSAKGFVNAVLRRFLREKFELSYVDEIEQVSVETSHPRWLIERWKDVLGMEMASKFARSNNKIPNTAFRLIGEPTGPSSGLAVSSRQSLNSDGCFLTDNRDQRLFDLAQQGEIYIQDEASQMTAKAVHVPPDGRFLDVCAAPGGKTGLIARRYSESAEILLAGDLHWTRVEYLRANCRNQQADSVRIVQFDAEKDLPFENRTFDCVFVDAPCSGTGTIRHNPELRYSIESIDFAELAKKQLLILNNASKLVRVGGSLIYSTCSIEREENEDVCGEFLSRSAEFSSVRPNVPDRFISEDGFARTWPHRDDMDGFFIAAFIRI